MSSEETSTVNPLTHTITCSSPPPTLTNARLYLRVRRICSKLSDFDKHMKNMTLHFLDRRYPTDLLRDAARRMDRHSLLHPTPGTQLKNTEWSILVTTYHPEDDSLKHIVTNDWSLLGKTIPPYLSSTENA